MRPTSFIKGRQATLSKGKRDMSTLHIKIEQDLYDQIKAISKSKDVSVSDSITAYLRAVVQTNSLSVNTQLSFAPHQPLPLLLPPNKASK